MTPKALADLRALLIDAYAEAYPPLPRFGAEFQVRFIDIILATPSGRALLERAERAERQLIAVNAIHKRATWPDMPDGNGVCWIDLQPWPCKTRQVLDTALAAPTHPEAGSM